MNQIRRFLYSPRAPQIIAAKVSELSALAVAAVTVWLCFGGPVFVLYARLIVGTVA